MTESSVVPSRLGKLTNQSRKKLFVISIAASFVGLATLATVQFYRHNMFGTGLLLGWDSSGYVWAAKNIVAFGPVFMIQHWGFPNLYIQLLALLGCLIGNFELVETILPLIFATLLVYASSRCTQEITGSVYIASLNVFLTALSLNTVRLFSDLHRNLMALSLSLVMMLWFSRSRDDRLVLNVRYLIIPVAFFLIASTHFETYVLLTGTLLLHTLMTRQYRKVVSWILPAAIPSVVLIPMLLGRAFFSSWTSEFAIGNPLRLGEIFLWLGGSAYVFLFFALGAIYLLYRSIKHRNDLSQLMLLWIVVITGMASMIETGILRFSHEVSFRLLLTVPVSILLSLSAAAAVNGTKNLKLKFRIFSNRKDYPLSLSVQKIALVLVLLMMVNATLVSFQHVDVFLTPYIPNSAYMKILEAKDYFDHNQSEIPVVIFHGDPAIWYGWLFRTYIGAELGEHFAYYGEFSDLAVLTASSSSFENQTERALSRAWYDEMQGRYKTMWPHSSAITDIEELALHPILIISPDLYDGQLPYYLRPFHIGNGIYVVPPSSITQTPEALYGPAVRVLRNGFSSQVRSEYTNIDPRDPTAFHVLVNASLGYESYTITEFPSSWSFIRIEQGGDLSFPERNPVRPYGTLAVEGNDPADTETYWKMPMNGSISIDTLSRKEGSASLNITGTVDSWGNLGAVYNGSGSWDLSGHSLMALWARSSEAAALSVDLIDSNGKSRTYFDIKADGSSAAPDWKRFAIDLSKYTIQTPGFDIGAVDSIFLYVYSTAKGKAMSFQVDDLTLDDFPAFPQSIYKARVLRGDSVVAYFLAKESA